MKSKIIFFLTFIFFSLPLIFYATGIAYGYKLGVGPCQLVTPIDIRILSYQGADYFTGASWAIGKWYAVTFLTHNLVTCDTITGQNTIIGNIGQVTGTPVALCWDPSISKMFMLTASPNNLYSVNINTGADSLIAPVTPFQEYSLMSGAINNYGTFYAIFHTGDYANPLLVRLNKTTGAASLRGVMFGGDNSGPQGIAFDRRPGGGTLYWLRYTTEGHSLLMRIDTISGIITSVATLPDSTHITGFIFTDNLVGINSISTEIPIKYSLNQNYPNPFNPVTKIQFSLPKQENTRLIIFDILGREVSILVNEQLAPGSYEVNFDGTDYASGLYYYSIQAGSYVETKKMILVK